MTGSELSSVPSAAGLLINDGVRQRVEIDVVMETIRCQPSEYQDKVLPPWIRPRLSLGASGSIGREQYADLDSAVTGMTGYGASAPGVGYWSGSGLRRRMFSAPRCRS